MRRYKDEQPAVRVYTVCDESKYMIVRNVPALGCGDELKQLFATYGQVEDCKPMDAEECEAFTDVYWIKFQQINNARFAKRKLDESVFLGNRLQVSYAPEYESLSDTKEKLDGRRNEVLARLNPGRSRGYEMKHGSVRNDSSSDGSQQHVITRQLDCEQRYDREIDQVSQVNNLSITRVSSDQRTDANFPNQLAELGGVTTSKDYFPSSSMNKTVKMVREKLNKIESSSSNAQASPASKKMRVDNRRRI